MGIGAIGNVYPTYVYNPTTVSSNSMNKLSRISDNVLDKKVDYSETYAQENENPLKKGQTVDFEGILAKQMQQGQNRAAKILPNGLEPVEKQGNEEKAEDVKTRERDAKSTVENVTVNPDAEDAASGNNNNVTQMQRAIQAYEMFMTA